MDLQTSVAFQLSTSSSSSDFERNVGAEGSKEIWEAVCLPFFLSAAALFPPVRLERLSFLLSIPARETLPHFGGGGGGLEGGGEKNKEKSQGFPVARFPSEITEFADTQFSKGTYIWGVGLFENRHVLWEWTGNRIICSLVNVGAEAIRPLATTVLLLPHPFVLLFSPRKKVTLPAPPFPSQSIFLCLPLLLFSLTVTQGKGKQLRNYNTIGYNKKKDLEFEPFKNRGAVTFFPTNPGGGSDFPSRDGSEEAKRPNRKGA